MGLNYELVIQEELLSAYHREWLWHITCLLVICLICTPSALGYTYQANHSCLCNIYNNIYNVIYAELTDEILDKYVIQDLFPFWKKLGKALNIQNEEDLPQDPAERLRTVLRKWKANGDHPSVSTLNTMLRQLGLQNFIPQGDSKEL